MDLMLLSSEATKLLKELQYLKQRFKRFCVCHRTILAIRYVYHCNAWAVLLLKDK